MDASFSGNEVIPDKYFDFVKLPPTITRFRNIISPQIIVKNRSKNLTYISWKYLFKRRSYN